MDRRLHWGPRCKKTGFQEVRVSPSLCFSCNLSLSFASHCKLLATGPGLRHWGTEELKWALSEQLYWTQGQGQKVCVRVHTHVSDWSMYTESVLLRKVQGSQAIVIHHVLQACTQRRVLVCAHNASFKWWVELWLWLFLTSDRCDTYNR